MLQHLRILVTGGAGLILECLSILRHTTTKSSSYKQSNYG